MDAIFHEKQEGSLCAQHCLNALLQNQYFSAVDLAQIGRRLDERERDRMAEGGVGSNEYQRFIEEPSSNYDDSGFFSVQVITEALSVWGLDVVLYNSQDPVAVQAREDPTMVTVLKTPINAILQLDICWSLAPSSQDAFSMQMSAFICNYHQHWFSVRKLGEQWFNLNSLLSGPELISDTYLSLFLTQLQQEGYSIFIVTGALPECEADQLLRLMPATQTVKPRLLTEKMEVGEGGGAEEVEDDDGVLQEALRASKELIDKDDTALQQALQMSMEGYLLDPANSSGPSEQQKTAAANRDTPSTSESKPVSQEELRKKRIEFLNKQPSGVANISGNAADTGQQEDQTEVKELTEEELLQKAIEMSMENS